MTVTDLPSVVTLKKKNTNFEEEAEDLLSSDGRLLKQ